MMDQGNLIMSILKKRHILKISSWEVMQQNLDSLGKTFMETSVIDW